ncbi:Gfo/Idh/MocA family protein [Roseisalinus antarcticus]|uniref:Glucose-6-phosphate 3-dehydrogenase n=1 Tax=Roseisalinus antarcticus TaxID=254357 RepID=A0A1Y5TWK2_9RHOB|nr:Gfo/Idh/MocA family oxidoreductase [Roseisalinus antarcticus]SLN72125.1 Glucose-6-phosphate 3-dehydrogenase [Roseisalinus antarcticus]
MKAAVVGAGWMGGVHAAAIAAAGDTVAVVIDADAARAAWLAERFGARAAPDLAAAEGCDAVVLATPSAAHLEQATEIAGMGLNLLVEKPHRLPYQNADALRTALVRGGAQYRVGLTTRFHPGLRNLKALLEANALGEVLSYSDSYHFRLDPGMLSEWYFSRATAGGGVVTTNGVHLIDRAGWLLDGRPELVDAAGLVPLIEGHEVEDHAEIRLRVADTPVRMSLLWAPFDTAPPELCIIGRKGIARVGLDFWRIETEKGVNEGRNDRPDDAFMEQWRSFRDLVEGGPGGSAPPDLDAMEHTMDTIVEIYSQAGLGP